MISVSPYHTLTRQALDTQTNNIMEYLATVYNDALFSALIDIGLPVPLKRNMIAHRISSVLDTLHKQGAIYQYVVACDANYNPMTWSGVSTYYCSVRMQASPMSASVVRIYGSEAPQERRQEVRGRTAIIKRG